MTIQVKRLAAGLGAEIAGADLTRDLTEEEFGVIDRAWQDHLILLFRGRPLTHAQHAAFSRRFGPLDDHAAIPKFRVPGHPEVLLVANQEIAGRRQPVGRQWHSDLTYTTRPARASLLRCEVIPEVGGDTMFTNMALAYEALSEPMRRFLEPLEAVHDLAIARHNRGRADLDEVRMRTPPVVQPVVRAHPRTGRKALYVNEMTTASIVGLAEEESRSLLDFLFRHCVQPEFTYRHRWSPGDLIGWDNVATLHLALDDYDIDTPRRMYRTTLLGEPSGRPARVAAQVA
jgi:taurine dioxygenase